MVFFDPCWHVIVIENLVNIKGQDACHKCNLMADIFKVLMVCENEELVKCPLQPVTAFLESQFDCNEHLDADVIIILCQGNHGNMPGRATGRSLGFSTKLCQRIAPTPVSEAFSFTTKGLERLECFRMKIKVAFKTSTAGCHCSFLAPFFSRGVTLSDTKKLLTLVNIPVP